MRDTEFIKTKSFRIAVYRKGSINAGKLALVLPGKLDTKDYSHMQSHVDFLSEKGYLALSFDPPGTWESDGDISVYSTTNYLKAVKELIEYYDSKPTLLIGHSRGGSVAILAGTKIKQVEKFIAIMSKNIRKPIIDKEWKEKGVHTLIRDTPEGYNEKTKTFELPYSFFEDSQKYDLKKDLKDCKKPKLFIAGEKDVTNSVDKVKELYDASSTPKELKIINSIHGYRSNQLMINKVNKLIDKFISENK